MEVYSFKLLSSQYQPHSKSVYMHLKTFLSISKLFIYSNIYIYLYILSTGFVPRPIFSYLTALLVSACIKYTWPFVLDWET